jgi:hypothetical protein
MADAAKPDKKKRPAPSKDRYTMEEALRMTRGDFSKKKKVY